MDTFAETPDLSGVYVTTANAPPVLRALHDRDLASRVTVITTDLFAELVPHIEAGRIAATIDQRPWIQGQIAFRTMYRYLLEGVRPPSFVRLAPHVVISHRLWRFYAQAAASESPEVHRLADTIEAWWPAVLASITTGYTNARSEGYNRLAKHVGRNAFGFRNPTNQRRRIRWACTRQHRRASVRKADLPG